MTELTNQMKNDVNRFVLRLESTSLRADLHTAQLRFPIDMSVTYAVAHAFLAAVCVDDGA